MYKYNALHPDVKKSIADDDPEALKMALDAKMVSVNDVFLGGKTLLHFACQNASYKCVELMVQEGSDVRK